MTYATKLKQEIIDDLTAMAAEADKLANTATQEASLRSIAISLSLRNRLLLAEVTPLRDTPPIF